MVLINGHPIDSEDFLCVAAYKNNVCVGARLWDPSSCGGGVCDVPVMGDDGSDETDGYMNPGEIPVFKVFNPSSGNLIDMNFYNINKQMLF